MAIVVYPFRCVVTHECFLFFVRETLLGCRNSFMGKKCEKGVENSSLMCFLDKWEGNKLKSD